MGLYHRLARSWTRPEAAAVEADGGVISYARLQERVARACGALRARGVGAGDVVLIGLPRSFAVVELQLACLALGAIPLPANDRYTAAELEYLVLDANARISFVSDAVADGVPGGVVRASEVRAELDGSEPYEPDEPSDSVIGALCYTSGTTGRPKGALLTHENLLGSVEALHSAWRWSADDVLVHCLPLFHIHGLFIAMYGALYAGARVDLRPRFDPDDALLRLAGGGTLFMGVPTFYQRFVDRPAGHDPDVSRVRLFTCGSAGLPETVWQRFRARYGHEILERYGMTECGIVLGNPHDDRRPGTVGKPLAGVTAFVADPDTDREAERGVVGELRIRSRGMFQGYLNALEKTRDSFQGGFLRTGDLATQDADGYFRIVGRRGDMLICGGFNVYPAEIEGVLGEHEDVAEVAVVGVPDADLGERAVASVVCRAGRVADPEALRSWCAQRLTGYKVPKRIRVVSELPRNAMGKIQKTALRAEWLRPVVRVATRADLEFLVAGNAAMALETEGLRLDPDRLREGVRRGLEGEAVYLVAEQADRVVGQCMITVEWSDWRNAEVHWLQSVFVLPDARGKGIYRALHTATLERARSAGAAGVRLYVEVRNQAAMQTYRKVGMSDGHYTVFEQMFD